MAGNATLRKPREPGTVQEPFRFMDLSTELRITIYRLADVNQSKIPWASGYYTLVPPAIAQVSKQIRTEVLPTFYGENSFRIHMDIDVLEYDEYSAPVKQDDDTKVGRVSSNVRLHGRQWWTSSYHEFDTELPRGSVGGYVKLSFWL